MAFLYFVEANKKFKKGKGAFMKKIIIREDVRRGVSLNVKVSVRLMMHCRAEWWISFRKMKMLRKSGVMYLWMELNIHLTLYVSWKMILS